MQRIIPNPQKVKYERSKVALDSSWKIRYAGRLTSEARYLQEHLQTSLGAELDSQPDSVAVAGKVIELAVNAENTNNLALPEKAEGYTLTIAADRIVINGSDNAGAFYGIQSLLSLVPAASTPRVNLPALTAVDLPRAPWRGMHYDMGRNFHGKEVTLRLIEQMARYKLNKLQLHLTEDEGWRIEIPGLPELTEIGAYRCFEIGRAHV